MSKRFKILALGAVMAMGLAGAKPAQAAIVNGGFEAFPDFAGWTTIGVTSVQDSNFKTPPEGGAQAFLSSASGAVSAASLESFLNLTAGSLTSKGAFNGSAIKQTVTAAAGDVISFKYDFATNETTPSAFNDFGFVSVSSTNVGVVADTTSSFVATNPLDGLNAFAPKETGYQTYTIKFNVGGTFTLGFGVVNHTDAINASGLLVDDVTQTAGPVVNPNLVINAINGGGGNGGGGVTVPLPAAVFIFPLGAAVAGAASKRFRRKLDAE